MLLVDLGGFAPPSRTLFSLLHTAITYIIQYLLIVVNGFQEVIRFGICLKITPIVGYKVVDPKPMQPYY